MVVGARQAGHALPVVTLRTEAEPAAPHGEHQVRNGQVGAVVRAVREVVQRTLAECGARGDVADARLGKVRQFGKDDLRCARTLEIGNLLHEGTDAPVDVAEASQQVRRAHSADRAEHDAAAAQQVAHHGNRFGKRMGVVRIREILVPEFDHAGARAGVFHEFAEQHPVQRRLRARRTVRIADGEDQVVDQGADIAAARTDGVAQSQLAVQGLSQRHLGILVALAEGPRELLQVGVFARRSDLRQEVDQTGDAGDGLRVRLRAQRRFEQVGLEQVFGFEPHTDALDEGQNLGIERQRRADGLRVDALQQVADPTQRRQVGSISQARKRVDERVQHVLAHDARIEFALQHLGTDRLQHVVAGLVGCHLPDGQRPHQDVDRGTPGRRTQQRLQRLVDLQRRDGMAALRLHVAVLDIAVFAADRVEAVVRIVSDSVAHFGHSLDLLNQRAQVLHVESGAAPRVLRGRQLDRRAVRDPAHAAPGEQPERRAACLGPVTVFEHGAVEPDPFFRIVRGAASVQLGRCQKEGLAECGIPVRLPGPGAERKQRGSEYEVAKRNVGRLHFSAGCRAAAVARCSAVTSHGKSDVQTNRFAGNFPVEDDFP